MQTIEPSALKVGMKVMVTDRPGIEDKSYVNFLVEVVALDGDYAVILYNAGTYPMRSTIKPSEFTFALPSPEFIAATTAAPEWPSEIGGVDGA